MQVHDSVTSDKPADQLVGRKMSGEMLFKDPESEKRVGFMVLML